jgi:hypothetical protein
LRPLPASGKLATSLQNYPPLLKTSCSPRGILNFQLWGLWIANFHDELVTRGIIKSLRTNECISTSGGKVWHHFWLGKAVYRVLPPPITPTRHQSSCLNFPRTVCSISSARSGAEAFPEGNRFLEGKNRRGIIRSST